MASIRFLAAMLACALTACYDSPADVHPIEESGQECVEIGNSADHTYCLISFVELIAHPGRWHERNIMLSGYVARYGDEIYFFPSEEDAVFGEKIVGLKLVSGERLEELSRLMQDESPRRLRLGGKFFVRGSAQPHDKGGAILLGYLAELREIRI